MKTAPSKKIKVSIVDTRNIFGLKSINKDLNGSYGTQDYFGHSLISKIFEKLRAKAVFLPHLTSVYVATILRNRGHTVNFYFDQIPKNHYDIFLIIGSIVDQKNENKIAGQLRNKHNKSKVGFIGTFPAKMPSLYPNADFIIDGEAEAFFLYQFNDFNELKGILKVEKLVNMEDLPSPDYSGFPIKSFSYRPILNQNPMLSIQSSRGCPYSCGYYCTYPTSQGKKVRQRSANAVVNDIIFMKKKFGMRSLLFRDPIFGINKDYPFLLSDQIIKKNVSIYWGIETRADLLTKGNLLSMYKAGLRSINIGIETNNIEIAKMNKRKLIESEHQKEIINYCNSIGIKVIGFFIIGMEGDTIDSIRDMIDFSIRQNTFIARFSVSTPYPGTEYFNFLDQANLLLNKEYQNYNQFKLVSYQEKLRSTDVEELLLEAYKKYYLRIDKISSLVFDQLKSYLPF